MAQFSLLGKKLASSTCAQLCPAKPHSANVKDGIVSIEKDITEHAHAAGARALQTAETLLAVAGRARKVHKCGRDGGKARAQHDGERGQLRCAWKDVASKRGRVAGSRHVGVVVRDGGFG